MHGDCDLPDLDTGPSHWHDALGVALQGNLHIDAIVAQGCRPIGRTMTVTDCSGHFLTALDERPAVEILVELYHQLDEAEQELLQRSLHLGVAATGLKSDLGRGGFLLRDVMQLDHEKSVISVGDLLRNGQTVLFHLRDPRTAGEDLDEMLDRYQRLHPDVDPSGALLFTCTGRGQRFFDIPGHDSGRFVERLGDIPQGGSSMVARSPPWGTVRICMAIPPPSPCSARRLNCSTQSCGVQVCVVATRVLQIAAYEDELMDRYGHGLWRVLFPVANGGWCLAPQSPQSQMRVIGPTLRLPTQLPDALLKAALQRQQSPAPVVVAQSHPEDPCRSSGWKGTRTLELQHEGRLRRDKFIEHPCQHWDSRRRRLTEKSNCQVVVASRCPTHCAGWPMCAQWRCDLRQRGARILRHRHGDEQSDSGASRPSASAAGLEASVEIPATLSGDRHDTRQLILPRADDLEIDSHIDVGFMQHA